MQRINFFVIALLLFCVHSIGNAQSANHQRTKIAIVGLVHSHCWGFVTKLNQMHQNQDLIEIVGISDDNQELRDYIKTQVPGVPVYDSYAKMLDEKKPEVVWSFVENDRHLEVTKACAARKIRINFEKLSRKYPQRSAKGGQPFKSHQHSTVSLLLSSLNLISC